MVKISIPLPVYSNLDEGTLYLFPSSCDHSFRETHHLSTKKHVQFRVSLVLWEKPHFTEDPVCPAVRCDFSEKTEVTQKRLLFSNFEMVMCLKRKSKVLVSSNIHK